MPARPRLAAAALLVAAAACGADPAAPARPGVVRGAITVVGDPLPPVGAEGAQVYLLADPDAPRTEAVRRGPVAGGPRVFTFALDPVPPGRYYLEACLEVGTGLACAPHPRAGGAPIEVRAGQVAEVNVLF